MWETLSQAMKLRAHNIVSHSAAGAWGPESDDRLFVDTERQLFVVANGTGPSYGGYHAPFGLDLGLESFRASYAGSQHPALRRMEAAFATAQRTMYTSSLSYRAALAGQTGLDACQRAADAVRPERWRHVESFCHYAGSITALCLEGDTLCVAQLGSCRAYVNTEGGHELVLEDHTLPTRVAAKHGEGSREHEDALALHRNVTLRLLGTSEHAYPDYTERILPTGTQVLLCSPGVWNHGAGEALVAELMSASEPELVQLLERNARNLGVDAAALRFETTTWARSRGCPIVDENPTSQGIFG